MDNHTNGSKNAQQSSKKEAINMKKTQTPSWLCSITGSMEDEAQEHMEEEFEKTRKTFKKHYGY